MATIKLVDGSTVTGKLVSVWGGNMATICDPERGAGHYYIGELVGGV